MADVIVIGAGINGLVTATVLARRGRQVIVVDRRPHPGGLAAGHAFHEGFRTAGLEGRSAQLAPAVIEHLGLAEHGLRTVPADGVLLSQSDGPGLMISDELDATAREIAVHSQRDAERYLEMCAFIERVRPVLHDLLTQAPPPWPGGRFEDLWRLGMHGLALRRLGRRDMIDLLRALPMTLSDWLGEWFETDALRAALAGPALYGTYLGPRSAGGVFNLLAQAALVGPTIAGGPAAVIDALISAARVAGVEIRTDAHVQRIVVDERVARGVELADGATLMASTVAASCDPLQTFMTLVPPAALDDAFAARIATFRARGTTAVMHLALSDPLTFKCRPDHAPVCGRIGERLDELEKAFDAVKYNAFSAVPVLDITVPSTHDANLAPAGQSVVTVGVHFAAHDLAGGWTTDRRSALNEAVMTVVERHCPGVRTHMLGHELITPHDLAERFALTGGHIHHGEHAIDQRLVRPTPQCMHYCTPIKNLYLCGRGTHPGGENTGLPGYLAAQVMLDQ